MKPLDILVLFDIRGTVEPGEDVGALVDPKSEKWKSEFTVIRTLKRLGHRVRLIALYDDITQLVDEIRLHRPDLVFNLVEEFNAQSQLERNVAGLLELIGIPYTGCGSAGITLCKNKALAKQILTQHQIATANFAVYERGKPIRLPKDVRFPMIVKPLRDDASTGISQASIVDSMATLKRRVRFIHVSLGQDALVEEYIHGRELYVSVIGHRQLEVLPVREMKFRRVPDEAPNVSTYRAKWDPKYRARWGINEEFADTLPKGVKARVQKLCRKAYRALQMDGYGRMDLRLTGKGEVVFLEANPNPFLAPDEDFAMSADKAGYPFDVLVDRILKLALHRPAA